MIHPSCSLAYSAIDSRLAVTRPFPVTSALFITGYASTSVQLCPPCEQPVNDLDRPLIRPTGSTVTMMSYRNAFYISNSITSENVRDSSFQSNELSTLTQSRPTKDRKPSRMFYRLHHPVMPFIFSPKPYHFNESLPSKWPNPLQSLSFLYPITISTLIVTVTLA